MNVAAVSVSIGYSNVATEIISAVQQYICMSLLNL
jgi:hypothetical protein